MDTQYIQIFLGVESEDSIYNVIEFLKKEGYKAYDVDSWRKLSVNSPTFKKRVSEWRRICFLRIDTKWKTVGISLNALNAKRVTIKEFMGNKIHIRSQVRPGMIIHLEAADLLVCASDVDDELICVNKSIHKCTPLNHLLNEDLSVSKHYNSNLKSISLNGETYYRPVIRLTLQEIADRLGYDVQSIQIVEK